MVKPGRKTTGKGAESASPVIPVRRSTRKSAVDKEAEIGDSLCARCVLHVYVHGNLDKPCDKSDKACSNCTRDHKGCHDIPDEFDEDVSRLLRMHQEHKKATLDVVQDSLRIDMRSKATILNEQIEEARPEPELSTMSEHGADMAALCAEIAAGLRKTAQAQENQNELSKHTYRTLTVSRIFPIGISMYVQILIGCRTSTLLLRRFITIS